MSDTDVVGLEEGVVSKKARNTKVTNSQRTMYLDFCETNPKFSCARLEGTYTKLKLDGDWKTLALLLNEAGPPTKTFAEWRGVSFCNELLMKQPFSNFNFCSVLVIGSKLLKEKHRL